MPAKSQAQKTAANMAHAIKKGYIEPKAGTASAEMAKSMTDKQISHFRKEGVEGGEPKKQILFTQDWKSKTGWTFKKDSSIPTWLDAQGNAQVFTPKGTAGLIEPEVIPTNVYKIIPNNHTDMDTQKLNEIGHIKLTEVLSKITEGEEERLGRYGDRNGIDPYRYYHSKAHTHPDQKLRKWFDRETVGTGSPYGTIYVAHSNVTFFFDVPPGKEEEARNSGLNKYPQGFGRQFFRGNEVSQATWDNWVKNFGEPKTEQ